MIVECSKEKEEEQGAGKQTDTSDFSISNM
jgi:hypothetical protein